MNDHLFRCHLNIHLAGDLTNIHSGMYFEEDLIDWGDGWEDNEDGERIPILAMDGTKPACLRIENLQETIDTPT